MLKKLFPRRKKKAVFVVQVTENAIKLVKCLSARPPEFTAIEVLPFSAPPDNARLSEKLTGVFRKLRFDSNPVIVSLPRSSVTSRFLKVPAQNPAEITRIVSLQAPRYLPYPADELNTGFQVISTDKEGYSEINLIIAHKEAVERYLTLLKEIRPSSVSVFLSSFGLCHLYQHCFPQEAVPVMLVDIDSDQAEVAIAHKKKYLFSRSFKFTTADSGWENLFSEEVKKARSLYLKEVAKEPPKKIIIFTAGKSYASLAESLKAQMGLPVEEVNYTERTGISKELSAAINSSAGSLASLIGLAVEEVSAYLNLLPLAVKEKAKNISERKSQVRLLLSISALIAIFGLALFRHFQNRSGYLKRMKSEMAKISDESRPLEAIEKRFHALENRPKEKLTALDALYQLHKAAPEQVAVSDFLYEEGSGVVIRGQAPELEHVFEFVARLRESDGFRKFGIEVKYATKKKTRAGEFVDFEIDCLKK